MTTSPLLFGILIAGSLLAGMLALFGVLATLRRMSFFGDGIAHASLAGIAIGFLVGANPLLSAIIFSAIAALVIYLLERKTSLSSDATIGVLFTAGMSLGVILTTLAAREHLELEDFLFGDILAIRWGDLIVIVAASLGLILLAMWRWRDLMLLSIDRDDAWLAGIRVGVVDAVFYMMLAVAVVLGANMLGIVLASAMLVIPASAAKLLSRSFRGLTVKSIILAEVTMIGGLFLADVFRVPSGAAIVLTGTFIFALAAFAFYLRNSV